MRSIFARLGVSRALCAAMAAGALISCAAAQSAGSLTIASLNLDKKPVTAARLREITQTPELRGADVFLLQEAIDSPRARVASDLGAALRREAVFSKACEWKPGIDEGLAILSKYPVTRSKTLPLARNYLHFHNRIRIAIVSEIQTPQGTVQVINVHLDNRINTRQKLAQLQPVWQAASQWRGPSIIGGDFNTGDFYWISHVIPIPYAQHIRAAVRKEMAAHGFKTPFGDTPGTLHFLGLHLDWIYVRQLNPVDARVLPIRFSDHNAIWTKLSLNGS